MITGRAALAAILLTSLANAELVNRYTFDSPDPSDAAIELDGGSDNTPIRLMHGARRVRDEDPARGMVLQAQPVSGENNDHKAGVLFAASSESTLKGTAGVSGITIMGWFKPMWDRPPTGTTSLIGLLRGDDAGATVAPTPHDGRALFEIVRTAGGMRIIALGRQQDNESLNPPATVKRQIRSDGTIDGEAGLLPANHWTWLAAVFDYDSGEITLYRNGATVIATTRDPRLIERPGAWKQTPQIDRTSNTASTGIKIGGQLNNDSTPFHGRIDEVRIYNHTMSADEIESTYRSQKQPPATAPAG